MQGLLPYVVRPGHWAPIGRCKHRLKDKKSCLGRAKGSCSWLAHLESIWLSLVSVLLAAYLVGTAYLVGMTYCPLLGLALLYFLRAALFWNASVVVRPGAFLKLG